MTAPGDAAAAGPAADHRRLDVLAYPSPTTGRFLVFLAALLSAGAFVGTWLHNELLADDWLRAVVRCEEQARQQTATLPPEQAALARVPAAARCRAPADRRRAAFSFGGAAAAGTTGIAVLYVVPGVIERRRRLRPLEPALEPARDRVASLALEAGLARTPAVVRGARLRDGFSYGTPGRYRIALPAAVAVRWRNRDLFDPLVRHELAHVAHRDVALSWLARSVWYALAPLLALPIAVILVSSDRSLLPDYLWRAVLLAVTVQLVSSALLRSREHDADLLAARAAGESRTIAAVVVRARDPGLSGWYRGLLANHPSPARRLAILERPELLADVTLLDGFTAAFLAALAVPLIVNGLVTFFMGSGRTDLAGIIAALVAGPLLGGSVGLGLWRSVLIQRAMGGRQRPFGVALGVAVGLVIGEVASLAQTGTGTVGEAQRPLSLLLVALGGLGVTALSAGLAEVWAGAAPVVRRASSSWATALVVNAVLFAAVLWVSGSLELAADQGGWVLARAWLVTVVASWLVLTALVVLALSTAWALLASRRGAVAPGWLLERGAPWPWPAGDHVGLAPAAIAGLAAGLAGAATIVAFRVIAGASTSTSANEQRYYIYVWVAAAAATAAALALSVLTLRGGIGTALLAGPLACLVAMGGFVAMNTALGGRLTVGFVVSAVRVPLALAFVVTLLAAAVGLLAWTGRPQVRWVWPAAAALGLVAAVAVVAGRTTLVGFPSSDAALLSASAGPSAVDPAVADARRFLTTVAPDLLRGYVAEQQAVLAIDADQNADGPARAARVRQEVLAPLRARLADVQAYQPASDQTRMVADACLAALRVAVDEFETFAAAFDKGDPTLLASAQAKRQQEQAQWQSCQAGLGTLQTTAGPR